MGKQQNPSVEEEDILEIISIGKLYTGPWHKKYWSSSRGKGRHPFPIGYCAARMRSGHTYRMEIREGRNGPLFVVSCADGVSGSGATPSSAWENHQRKSSPIVKNGCGRRFSEKIDGGELFGFRNLSVKRLFRELVVEFNGIVEQSLVSSPIDNGASQLDNKNQTPGTCICPDSLPYMVKQQFEGKRNGKQNTDILHLPSHPKLISHEKEAYVSTQENNFPCCLNGRNAQQSTGASVFSLDHRFVKDGQILDHSTKSEKTDNISLTHPAGQNFGNDECGASEIPDKNCVLTIDTTKFSMEMKSFDASDRDHNIGTDGLHVEEPNSPGWFVEEHAIPYETKEFVDSDIKFDTPDRLSDAQLDGRHSKKPNKNEEKMETSKDVWFSMDSDTCIPDTLDSTQGGRECLPVKVKELIAVEPMQTSTCPCDIPSTDIPKVFVNKNELPNSKSIDAPSAEKFYSAVPAQNESEGLEESQSELGASSSSSITCSQTNLDPSGQDLARSMMTLLLPRALPLLKTYKRKRRKNQVQETNRVPSFCQDGSKTEDQNDDIVANINSVVARGANVTENLPTKRSEQNSEIHGIQTVSATVTSNEFYVHKMSAGHCMKNEPVTEPQNMSYANSVIPDSFDFEITSLLCPDEEIKSTGDKLVADLCSSQAPTKGAVPLAESIICRDVADNNMDAYNDAAKELHVAKISQAIYEDYIVERAHMAYDVITNMQHFKRSSSIPEHEGLPTDAACVVFKNLVTCDPAVMECLSGPPQVQTLEKAVSGQNTESVLEANVYSSKDPLVMSVDDISEKHHSATKLCRKNVMDCSSSKDAKANESKGYLELKGCYIHPDPILSIFLISKEGKLQICVLSGCLEGIDRNLFIYKVDLEKQRAEFPSFLGYTPLTFPVTHGLSNRSILLERSGLQFSPEGQFLILHNDIRVPFCREQNANCLCSVCRALCFGENGIRILHVEFGYVSVVTNLTTAKWVHYILVCNTHVVAAEESGELHVWKMNSDWRATLEEFFLPGFFYVSHMIFDLKKVPNCDSLIIGHNSVGDFGLWDISKRNLMARFSSPGNSVFQALPVSFFSWRENVITNNLRTEDPLKNVIEKPILHNSQAGLNDPDHPSTEEDIAVWLLVSASSDSEDSYYHLVEEPHLSPIGRWRLALLAKETFIMGPLLDARSSAVETSFGCGILGTTDGLLCVWNLSTGEKVGSMDSCKGESISCIAADEKSGAFVVASNSRRLLVYAQSCGMSCC